MLATLLGILLVICFGFVIIENFSVLRKQPFLEKIAYSYGLGIGLISLEMLIYSLLGIRWSLIALLVPWIFPIALFMKAKKYKQLFFTRKIFPPSSWFDRLFIFLIVTTVVYVLLEATIRPVAGWDPFATWLMTGKAFYIDRTIDSSIYTYMNYDIPPFIGLFVAFGYIVLGQVNDTTVLLFFSSFYIAILLLFYFTSRKYISSRYALLFTFLLATIQNLIRHAGKFDVGYADLPLAFYFFASSILLLLFLQSRSIKTLILLSFFLGTGALIKNDGVPFFLFVEMIGIFFAIRWGKYKYILAAFPGFLLFGAWQMYKVIFSVQESYLFHGTIDVARVPAILLEMGKEFLNVRRWNISWLIFFVSLIKTSDFSAKILILILLFQLFSYLFVYMVTPIGISQIKNSFDRLLIHLVPIAMLIVVTNFSKFRLKYD